MNKKHWKTKTPKRRVVDENLAKHMVFVFLTKKPPKHKRHTRRGGRPTCYLVVVGGGGGGWWWVGVGGGGWGDGGGGDRGKIQQDTTEPLLQASPNGRKYNWLLQCLYKCCHSLRKNHGTALRFPEPKLSKGGCDSSLLFVHERRLDMIILVM